LIFDLRENHQIFTSLVVYPVVPKNVILLRLIPTAAHTLEDVAYTIEKFEIISNKLKNNEYSKDEFTWIKEAPKWITKKSGYVNT